MKTKKRKRANSELKSQENDSTALESKKNRMGNQYSPRQN